MLARLRTVAPLLVILLALIVLTVRLSGTHAHRYVSSADNALLHELGHHAHGHHHDTHVDDGLHAHAEGQVDIKLDSLSAQADRPGTFSPLLLALLLTVSLFLAARRRIDPLPPKGPGQRPITRSHWRPQLRGPPAASIA